MTEVYKPPKMWLKYLFILGWGWAVIHVLLFFVAAYLSVFVGGEKLANWAAMQFMIGLVSAIGIAGWSSGTPWEKWTDR